MVVKILVNGCGKVRTSSSHCVACFWHRAITGQPPFTPLYHGSSTSRHVSLAPALCSSFHVLTGSAVIHSLVIRQQGAYSAVGVLYGLYLPRALCRAHHAGSELSWDRSHPAQCEGRTFCPFHLAFVVLPALILASVAVHGSRATWHTCRSRPSRCNIPCH